MPMPPSMVPDITTSFFPFRVISGEGTLQYCLCKLDTYHKPLCVQSQEFTCLYVFPDSPRTRPFMNVDILNHIYLYIYKYIYIYINVILLKLIYPMHVNSFVDFCARL